MSMKLQKPAGHQYLTYKIITFTLLGLLTKWQTTTALLVNFWFKKLSKSSSAKYYSFCCSNHCALTRFSSPIQPISLILENKNKKCLYYNHILKPQQEQRHTFQITNKFSTLKIEKEISL
jgi:hypothetical protein